MICSRNLSDAGRIRGVEGLKNFTVSFDSISRDTFFGLSSFGLNLGDLTA